MTDQPNCRSVMRRMEIKLLTTEQYSKLHNSLIQDSLKITNQMGLEGMEIIKWNLTNGCTVTFRCGKRAYHKIQSKTISTKLSLGDAKK